MEANLVMHISRANMSTEVKDIQVWRCDESGVFSLNSAYERLTKHERGPHHDVFKYLWKAKAFPNVITTTWRVLLGRIPTRKGLTRRGVMLDTILCALCQTKDESCQHLFLECKVAQFVWSLCFKCIGILFVQHNDLMNHFESFYLSQTSSTQNLLWKGVWAATMMCIWEHKNSIVFKQGVVDAEEIFQTAQLKSWLWLKHRVHTFNYSFVDWVLNPLICIGSYK